MSSALVLPAAAAATPPQELPGHRAMWVAICLEFLEFAVFFAVYFSARWHHPRAFQEGAHRLWTSGGVAITAAMVSSGWMLTRVLAAMRADRRRAAMLWLAAALLVGACYPLGHVVPAHR